MGRIDDAMRRSAGGEKTPEAPDAATLAREQFPDVTTQAVVEETSARPDRLDMSAPPPANGAETAGLFERVSAEATEKLVLSETIMTASREQYRRLAAVLHSGREASDLSVVMVASAVASEGKTLTASNLALTLSESYQQSALLIDADLRRPSLEQLFGIPGGPGLSEGLMSAEPKKLPIHRLSSCLSVLPAGRPTNDPMAGLTSPRMSQILAEAKESFDWIIVDTPPVVLLPDAHLLATMVDAAVLVVRAATTPHELITRAIGSIGKQRILGVVLNGARPQHQTTQGYYSYYGYQAYYGGQRAAS